MPYMTESNLAEIHHKIRRLDEANTAMVEALENARSQLSAIGGTVGVHMGDEDARESGCDMIQRAVVMQIDAAIAKATGVL